MIDRADREPESDEEHAERQSRDTLAQRLARGPED